MALLPQPLIHLIPAGISTILLEIHIRTQGFDSKSEVACLSLMRLINCLPITEFWVESEQPRGLHSRMLQSSMPTSLAD